MRIFSFIMIIIVVTLGSTFAVLNADNVNFNYYLDQTSLPLSILLITSFALGCVIGVLSSLVAIFKAKMAYYRLKQRLLLAEKEIENLRTIPLRDKV